jgi:hypothetical protein
MERLAMHAITPMNSVIQLFARQISPNLSRKSNKSLHGFNTSKYL